MAANDGVLDLLARNLWLLLTIAIPGLVTYGLLRIMFFFEPPDPQLVVAINKIDSSTILSVSIIVTIAAIQQMMAMIIEIILAFISKLFNAEMPGLYKLLCCRFGMIGLGVLNEESMRIIGNFFTSLNITAGFGLLLLFFYIFQEFQIADYIPMILMFLIVLGLASSLFRLVNASWMMSALEKGSAS